MVKKNKYFLKPTCEQLCFRICIGKTMAETSIIMFIIRIFSQFQVSWNGGELDSVSVPIQKPDVPLLFDFKPIESQ